MSQPVPPPGNPFAEGAAPQPYPMAPAPAPARANLALGLLAGFGGAIVGALVLGGIMRAMAKEDGSYTQLGILALGVGALVGFALGKVGGAHPVLPFAGVPIALFGVFAGQLFGYALMASWWAELDGQSLPVTEILTSHFSDLLTAWKEELGAMDLLFFAIAGYEGFVITKKISA
ncbi:MULTISPECIES: hypothetical protein [unclassified Streptomyces]|uniref:hypothetical protein n=1 Tax=unclassified Streptomyces TaxID=2593676 RepID=UPI0006F4EC95|nr:MULTISPECIES: hypothetical protein [unclassified Streptomyces]KQX59104.1 hypothetical protein ASD33_02055 [Streptomyces sp. Root1304]KRB00365.1 hypothetical protein ASE09_02055 [Streptomyces sp. Root66D1]